MQLQLILQRLKKPSVIASLSSQIVMLIMLFNVDIDATLVTSIITNVTSILVILGILSNPDSKHKDFRDDISPCTECGEMTQHVQIGDEMICKICGCSSDSTPNQ